MLIFRCYGLSFISENYEYKCARFYMNMIAWIIKKRDYPIKGNLFLFKFDTSKY